MISGVYVLHRPEGPDSHFELLIHRSYDHDLPHHHYIVSTFEQIYTRCPTPVISHLGIHYVCVQRLNGICILAVARQNLNVMSLVTYLYNFFHVLEQYLENGLLVDRDVIFDNFVLIYELLDECMDFGVVQTTDYNILKEYIKLEANFADETKLNTSVKSTHNQAINQDVSNSDSHINSSILRTSSLAISWRPKGIFYAKNEIYIDIIESCDFLFDLNANAIKMNEIKGECVVRCYLSGMPICKLGFNEPNILKIGRDENVIETIGDQGDGMNIDTEEKSDDKTETPEASESNEDLSKSGSNSISNETSKIPIRNIQFHQCIELGSIYKDGIIQFTPPDDKFTFMSYHVEQQKQRHKLPIIMIDPTYRIQREQNKLQVLCVLSTNFKKRLHCKQLSIRIPVNPRLFKLVPNDLKYKAERGEVHFKVDDSEIVWMIDSVDGGLKSIKMMAELSLKHSHHLDVKTIENLLYNRTEMKWEPDSNSEDELDRYYGVNGAKISLFDEVQQQLNKSSHNYVLLEFNIASLSYSGLKLSYLRVDEEQMKYTCFPWVRYVTKAPVNGYRFKLGVESFKLI